MRPTQESSPAAPETHLGEHDALDLLLGLLPPERESAHLSHLQRCAPCEARFIALAAGAQKLEATRSLRRAADGTLTLAKRGTAADERAEEPAQRPGSRAAGIRRIPLFGRGSFAASALAAAAIVLLLLLPRAIDRGPLSLNPLPPYGTELQLRDAASAMNSRLAAGLAAYGAGETARAVELLREAQAGELDELDSLIRTVYLGSALALEGRNEEAVAALDDAPLSLLPGEWGAEAKWTLFVALSETGHAERARVVLAELERLAGEIGERARLAAGRSAE